MKARMSVTVLTGLLLCSSGCGTKTQAQPAAKAVGGVGVVDLDAVAKRIGRDIEMNDAVQERVAALNGKLTSLQSSLRRLYEEKQDKFGDEPSPAETKELQATQARMDEQLLEVRRKAEAELATFRQALIDQFREQAKPVLREVAAARGLSIVVPKNDGLLLTIDPAVEITDEVAQKMPATTAGKTEPAAAQPKKRTAETSAR